MATRRSTGDSAKSARTTAKSTRTTAKSARAGTKPARTIAKSAGKPVVEGAKGALRARSAAARPTPEELDLRDRLKSQPRRPAGPPLVGDVQTRGAMDALRNEVLPKPTEPSGTGS